MGAAHPTRRHNMNAKELIDSINLRFDMYAEERISTEELQGFIVAVVMQYLDEMHKALKDIQQTVDKL
jgi:hypothetical protein